MARKKITTTTPGNHAPKKLREDQVRRIRELRVEGLTLHSIAERYGVSESLVSRICSGKAHGPVEAR